jgi:type I site-specific restriction endonuclease
MSILKLPEYSFRFKEEEGKKFIFDDIRKSFVALTPEEWVRQNFIRFLNEEKAYPLSLMAVEKSLKVYSLAKRADIVIYDRKGSPVLIVECKAPHVKISQDAFDQAARYNIKLQVNYLVVTNGMEHFCCKIDLTGETYSFMKDIPMYGELK